MDAVIEACRLRLRPILMTSIAFCAGVIPLILGSGAAAKMRRAMGIAVFSGMLGVTLFGIFLTPVFYACCAEHRAAPPARRCPARPGGRLRPRLPPGVDDQKEGPVMLTRLTTLAAAAPPSSPAACAAPSLPAGPQALAPQAFSGAGAANSAQALSLAQAFEGKRAVAGPR